MIWQQSNLHIPWDVVVCLGQTLFGSIEWVKAQITRDHKTNINSFLNHHSRNMFKYWVEIFWFKKWNILGILPGKFKLSVSELLVLWRPDCSLLTGERSYLFWNHWVTDSVRLSEVWAPHRKLVRRRYFPPLHVVFLWWCSLGGLYFWMVLNKPIIIISDDICSQDRMVGRGLCIWWEARSIICTHQ